jgi:DNA topoisomerase-1
MKTLLIVESPAKASTIQKYLGNGYSVSASMGHLFDLPKSRLAIDIDHGFEPEYITIRGKAKILKTLRQEARKADRIMLASDNDREGEAISHHLKKALLEKLPGKEVQRIVFNEITPAAIREAIKHPGDIDSAKVDAQKARRILDRLVGYGLSPILWKKVKNGLSAGRVQSVALRLIAEREEAVESFVPEEYWSLETELQKGKALFRALLVEYQGRKPELRRYEDVLRISESLRDGKAVVAELRTTEKTLKPKAPFTTSTMQQAAASRLGFTSYKTMQIAQQLYEGINIGSGRVGLITYMRTDSTRLSATALEDIRAYIGAHHPGALPAQPVIYALGKKAQDAHEAIRPTYARNSPDSIKSNLTRDQLKLYSLIWERAVSSQMSAARTETLTVDLRVKDGLFRASSTRLVAPGFQSVLKLLKGKEKIKALPQLTVGEELEILHFHPEQHFTSGPARFTDATIIKALEEKGIGRPSTYAPIISVLLNRYYVVRKNRQLVPTQLGRIINSLLSASFPDLVNENFTAELEKKLDDIAENKERWSDIIDSFYASFKPQVDHVMETLESFKGVLDEPTDMSCEKCGRPMVKKLGRYGFFIACTGFPECRNTRAVPLADCPRPGCDGQIVARRKQGGRGKEFYGCNNYPECDFVTHFMPTRLSCPQCGYFLVEKEDKQRGAYKSCINPECDYLHTQEGEDQSA